jgi:hypothetical protein
VNLHQVLGQFSQFAAIFEAQHGYELLNFH